MKSDLAESMGLRGDWVLLRAVWNGKEYVHEYNDGDGKWKHYSDAVAAQVNVVSIRYFGGEKDGEVEI